MGLLRVMRFVTSQPLTNERRLLAAARFIAWQVRSRVCPTWEFPWVDDTKLIVSRGMTGATGNLYVGLHEFREMGFLLHFLREGDLFVDVGANVGTYTVLASGVCGARSITFEPVPSAVERLRRNVEANRIESLVELRTEAVGEAPGRIGFSTGQDTVNHAIPAGESAGGALEVEITTLDSVLGSRVPQLIKIDVEGFELPVLRGAANTLNHKNLLAVIVEMNGSGERYGFTDSKVNEALTSRGFRAFDYEPLSRTLALSSHQVQQNVIYLRDRAEVVERLNGACPRRIHPVARSL